MPTHHKPLGALVAALLLLVAACTTEGAATEATPAITSASSSPASTATTTNAFDEGTAFGFFPFPQGDTFEDVLDHFSDLADHADVVLVQPAVAWEEFTGPQSDDDSPARENLRNLTTIAEQHGLGTVYVVDPLNGLDRTQFFDLPPGWDPSFATPEVRAAITNQALWIVDEFHPRYLGLASEINTYVSAFPDETQHVLSLYRELYQAIKAESPETQVFVTFQWEVVTGAGFAGTGANEDLTPNWDQIEMFEPNLDLWVISSYPFVSFSTGAEIPSDYYTPLLERTAKPLAVAEGGFISRQTGPFSGTPQDQVDHLTAVHDQIGDRLAFWIQLLLDDFDPVAIADPMREQGRSERDIETLGMFAAIGLRDAAGTAKPAMAVWDSYRAAP